MAKSKSLVRTSQDIQDWDSGLECTDETLAVQAQKDECDINNILKTYIKTGVLPSTSREGVYADVSNLGDYHTAMNTVLAAQDAFDALPAHVRAHFENDPGKFVEACQSPDTDIEELSKLGLITQEAADAARQSAAKAAAPTNGQPVPAAPASAKADA